MKKLSFLIAIVFSIALFSCQDTNNGLFVSNQSEFEILIPKLNAGDTVILANGIWQDTELEFYGKGTADNPIVLMPETPGEVVFKGKSCIKLGGEFLHVTGFKFTEGQTPSQAVIMFRIDKEKVANNSRVSHCAIIGFNQSERFEKDNWVAIYGKNNRFDHNYLSGKLNGGVTMVVYLNDVKNQDNNHRIDHNYFGERKRLGSNGGETMRVGTSTYSLTNANTLIEENYFEKCNGEVEALSIKASNVTVRRNAFFECEGSLVLRHGNNNKLLENIFIGNNKPSTGGLRVINAGHEVKGNYFYQVTGERFRSALAVMNGVPNSAINRYHQVKDANISNNTFIDCSNIQFGVGTDKERSATPVNTSFTDNTIYSSTGNPVKFLDDISGIQFDGNKCNFTYAAKGFMTSTLSFSKNDEGLFQYDSESGNEISNNEATSSDLLLQKKNAGPDWFNIELAENKEEPNIFQVSNDESALQKAVNDSKCGDIIVLQSAESYIFSEPIHIDKKLVIKAAEGLDKRPELVFDDEKSKRAAFFIIENDAHFTIEGIAFKGTTDKGNKAQSGIRTAEKSLITPYYLKVIDCEFHNFNESRYNAFTATKGSYADSIIFEGCLFHTTSGDAISIAAEKEDRGIYNAEYVVLDNCVFYNIMGSALDLYRGGNDESTLGPYLTVDHCVFENVNNKELGSCLRLIGVQNVLVQNSLFSNSGQGGRSIKFEETRWDHCKVVNCNFYNSGRVESFYDKVLDGPSYRHQPEYVSEENKDFNLTNKSVFQKTELIGLNRK